MKKHTNNIYLITFNGVFSELTGVANCYNNDILLTEIMIGIHQDPKTGGLSLTKMIITIDSELFRDFSVSNTDITFRVDTIGVQVTTIK